MKGNDKISLGEFLQETRKEKGVSIDEIVRETNISKSYLEALEDNKFEDFPGETYVLGFLSTYAEALEIDRQLVSSMYRRQMQIEQDAPLEELVGTRKRSSFSPQLLIPGLVVISAILIAILFASHKPSAIKKNSHISSKLSVPAQIVLTPDSIAKLSSTPLKEGDNIFISNRTNPILLSIKRFTSSKAIDLTINSINHNMKKGEILNIDTDNNNIADMGVEIVEIKNKKVYLSLIFIPETNTVASSSESNTIDISKYQDVILLEKTIFTASVKQATDIKLQFKAKGWMEYQTDQDKPRQLEMKSGQFFTIHMKNSLTLSLANAGAATLLINDKVEKGGKLGEVNKSLFYWKNESGKFQLMRAFLK